jgi:two-component system LytT family response regulator
MRAIQVHNDYKGIHPVEKQGDQNGRHLKIIAPHPNLGDASFQNFSHPASPMEMRLCLPSHKGFTIVKLDEIVYCEAQRSYTQFHFINQKPVTVSKPLFDYDKLLADTTFLRVHKSFFINLLHVKEYTRGEGGTVIMSNGMEIDISRRKKEQFLARIREFFKY